MREHGGPECGFLTMQTAATSSPRLRPGRPLTWLLFIAPVVAIPLIATTLAIDRLPARYDEFVHIDCVRRIEHGDPAGRGEDPA